jgi:hypothetical protein
MCDSLINATLDSNKITVLILQIKETWGNWFEPNELLALVAAVTALVVGVFTILSISISLHKEKIWGIKADDFRKLAKPFSLLCIMIIFLILIALNIIAMLFNCEIACIIISIFSIGFAICFCVQEIPILTREEKRLWKIVKKNIKYEKKGNLYVIKLPKNLDGVISHLLFEKNISEVYRELSCKFIGCECKKKNTALLDELLVKQNERLFKDKSFEILLLEKNDADIPITQIHESAIENIKIILKLEKTDIVEILTESSYDRVAQSLLAIANSKIYTTDNKANNDINEKLFDIFANNIFSPLVCEKRKIEIEKRNFFFGIIMAVLSYTINNGNDWFLKILRKYYKNETEMINNYTNMPEFFIITCWLLYNAQKEGSLANDDVKKMIYKFVNESDKKKSIWKELYKDITVFGCSEQEHFSIKTLLDIYKINELHNVGTNVDININEYLPGKSLLNWFFEMLFSSDYSHDTEPQELFVNCNKVEKERIADYLKHEWIDEDDRIKNKLLKGQRFFDPNRSCTKPQENFNNLIAWANQMLKNFVEDSFGVVNDDFLIELKKSMIEKVKSNLQKLPSFNDKIDLSDTQIEKLRNYCHKTQNDMQALAVINSYIKTIPDRIISKGLNFNFEIDEKESKVEFLADEEINEKINTQYSKGDGRYFYYDLKCNIFMTREELFNIIKKKHFVMQLAFRIKEKTNAA